MDGETHRDQYSVNKKAYKKLQLQNDQMGGVHKSLKPTVSMDTNTGSNHYILHSTNFKNMIQILKSNTLSANKHINKKYRRLSGRESSDYVFANMIINDHDQGIKSETPTPVNNFGIGLMFDRKILIDRPFIFNYGWIGGMNDKSIVVKSNEPSKIESVYRIVERMRKITDHEILFKDAIDLKYLIGIHCPECPESQKKKIQKLLKKGGYLGVKIYDSDTLPII